MKAQLRALVEKWRAYSKHELAKADNQKDFEQVCLSTGFAEALDHAADELEAVLRVADPREEQETGPELPEWVSVVPCEHGGVQIEGHTLEQDWQLEMDAQGNALSWLWEKTAAARPRSGGE